MWILLDGPYLLRYRDGKLEDAYARFGMQDSAFTAMSRDSKGGLLLSGLGHPTLRYRDGKFETVAHSDEGPGTVLSVTETRDGRIWMGTPDDGLFRIDQEHISNVSRELANSKVNALLPASNGGLWIGTDAGIKFWDGSALAKIGPLSSIGQLQILAMIKDRQANVWIGTNHGLFRMAPDGAISPDPDSNGKVTTICEDRDGDIWFGGLRGIERLRNGIFTTYSTAQGLPSESTGPIYVDFEGRTWFAPLSGGLYWLKDGRVGRVFNRWS